ncbi:hypothetical protein ACFUAC_10095 [Streptomyces sp. NPDC057148]|uniref:hypothetical protein n=1 Tax=unclassified Streptomyces TaxID=2593676 RepID=UPI00363FD66C
MVVGVQAELERELLAGQFEGAQAVSAQQDALLAEQDRADADCRVGCWRSDAAGSAGDARRPVGKAPGAEE